MSDDSTNRPPVRTSTPQLDRNGPIANVNNAEIMLMTLAGVEDMLGWDVFYDRPILWHPVPVPDAGGDAFPAKYDEPVPLNDNDLVGIRVYLQQVGQMMYLRGGDSDAAVMRVAKRRPYHPVKTYLESLVWDGVERIGGGSGEAPSWLKTWVGAENNEYTRVVGRISLVAMIARIYSPGCKYDYVPIFEGGQGAKKSTFLLILTQPWFSDCLPCDIESKDASLHLKGLWGIELGELAQFKRAQMEELKRFVSRQREKYRPPYGRMEVEEPRSCVFFGTTNEETYLSDVTGNRRFFPVKIGIVDEIGLAQIRDQLLAEALAAFRAGEAWWPEGTFEDDQARQEQAQRMDVDPWAEKILAYVRNRDRLSYSGIAESSLGIETKNLNNFHRDRIKAVLIQAKWEFRKIAGARYWMNPVKKGGGLVGG